MATPVNSPIVSAYASRSPYLTLAEYLASPTGVDVSQLVVGGTTQQNADALTQTIARASSAVDQYCRQVVAATLDVQAGTYRLQRGGYLKIPLDRTPILQIIDVAIAAVFTPNARTSLPDLSNVMVGRKVIDVPVYNVTLPTTPTGTTYGTYDRLYAVTQYVNGYANALLTLQATAGQYTLTVDNPLGVFTGVEMTIYDPGQTETVIVLSVSGNVITTVTALQYTHAIGVNVSAFPPAIKQAAVLYTTMLIKTRSDDSFEMPSIGSEPSQMTKTTASGGPEQTLAEFLLTDHRRIV